MKKSSIIISAVLIILVALIGAGIMYMKQYAPKYDWRVFLRHTKDEPYDTKLLYQLLENTYDKNEFTLIQKNLKKEIDEAQTNTLLFFIGRFAYYDSVTVESIKDFIYRGNTVCIAAEIAPDELLAALSNQDSVDFIENDYRNHLISTHFTQDSAKKFRFHYQLLKDTAEYNWVYLTKSKVEEYFWNRQNTYVSYLDNQYPNFVKIYYGEGTFFLYTTPILLSNYYLSKEPGYNYAAQFFNEIGTHNKVIWDNSSLVFTNFQNRSLDSENLLEFILSKSSLRWSWYLCIAGVMLFIIFRLKRQQKPVPVLIPDKNASIEYAKAVGLLYYKTSSHQDLSEHMMKLFYNFIKTRYNLNIKEEKKLLIKQIAISSGLQHKEISAIFDAHIKVKFNPQAEATHTIKLHSTLDNFYKNCK